MNNFYAITMTSTGTKALSQATYNRSLDALETKYNCRIFPRIFEVGKVMKKLHVHALLKRSVTYPELISVTAEKNKNIKLDKVHDMQGWLNYMNKENPKPLKKLF